MICSLFATIQMSSSESDMDGSESEDDELFDMRVMQLMRQNQSNLSLTACS